MCMWGNVPNTGHKAAAVTLPFYLRPQNRSLEPLEGGMTLMNLNI